MAPNLSDFEVLALYSEAIQKMLKNPGVQPLFRDIFKNAYRPGVGLRFVTQHQSVKKEPLSSLIDLSMQLKGAVLWQILGDTIDPSLVKTKIKPLKEGFSHV